MIGRFGLFAALFLAGCSTIGRTVTSLPDGAGYVQLPRPVTLPRSRLTNDCCPESICAVMGYWGKPATVQELSLLVRDPSIHGVRSPHLPPLARQKGLKVAVLEGSVGRLKEAIDRGVPPIIMVETGGGFHFFVVTGYSDAERMIACEEYEDLKRLIPYDETEELWKPTGHVMLELEPATPDADLEAGANLEIEGRYKEAAVFYRRALKADPGLVDARVGLGTCLYRTGKREQALAEYRRACEDDPTHAKACNNLAHLLLELGQQTAEAGRLAGRAVERLRSDREKARRAVELERQPAIRELRRKDLTQVELELAYALGTLGQAHEAGGRHEPALEAWKASLGLLPPTAPDLRARRLLAMARSCRALSRPDEARGHLEGALREARDPDLRAKIEKALRE